MAASGEKNIGAVLTATPTLRQEVIAVLTLAHCGEAWATPIISKTSASGTLLKRKLEPIVEPLLSQIAVLQGKK